MRTADEDNPIDSTMSPFFFTYDHDLSLFYCNCFDIIIYLFISSPEHKVLKMRYRDSAMSGVRRPPIISLNIFFSYTTGQVTNLDETWQGCSLGVALQKCSKNSITPITLVAMAIKREKKAKSLKLFSSETRRRTIHSNDIPI